jgi:hypothetical protein
MSTELFTEAEMPFNLISETIAAPVKILSPREEEAARTATVRAGGYENTPSMFESAFKSLPACHEASPQHAAYVARVEELEAEGCDTSDAQGIADMEFDGLLTQTKKPTKPNHKMKITDINDIEPGITTEAELTQDDAEILPALVNGQPVITPEPNSGMSEGREI